MTFRAAIWAAVSTEGQADKLKDKASLETQEDEARAKIAAFGWTETAGPFIVDGESRTKWASLYHAEKNIPPLRNMIDAAEKGLFNVLVVYDFNRFRSLLRQVFDVLCDYDVQMYSLKDKHEPVKKYDAKAKHAMGTVIDLNALLSNNQGGSLAIHFADGMPKKVLEHGLHPGIGPIPYGYKKPAGHEFDKKAVFEPSADAQDVIKMKDLYLSGVSATAIARIMNSEGKHSLRGNKWNPRSVAYILKNEFYAGLVAWGKSKNQRNRRDGSHTVLATPARMAKGRHQGLWDEDTYRRLLWEFERRGNGKVDHTKVLSKLMYCWCGERITAGQVPQTKKSIPGDFFWACKSRKSGHFYKRNSVAIHLFIEALTEKLKGVSDVEPQPHEDPIPDLEKKKKDLERKRQRWITDYEDEKINAEDYTKRTQELTEEIELLDKEIRDFKEDRNQIEYEYSVLKTFADTLEYFPEYILNEPAAQVNTDLHAFIRGVYIDKDGKMEIKLISS